MHSINIDICQESGRKTGATKTAVNFIDSQCFYRSVHVFSIVITANHRSLKIFFLGPPRSENFHLNLSRSRARRVVEGMKSHLIQRVLISRRLYRDQIFKVGCELFDKSCGKFYWKDLIGFVSRKTDLKGWRKSAA